MKVRKENRVLTVDEADKAFYLSEGYEVVELAKDGKSYEVVEQATGGKTYTIAEFEAMRTKYEAKITELEKALAERTEPPAELSREDMMAALKAAKVEFKGNISNENLKAMYWQYIGGDGE